MGSALPTEAQVFRVSANASDVVTTQGFSLGANYYFAKYFQLKGNFSFNRLNTQSDDPIIPAFNTPEFKYNIGLSARDLSLFDNLLGFSIVYKWIEGFTFEGSPQFTGFIPTYDLIDAQISYTIPSINIAFKLGASNLLNQRNFQTFGGPRIGRLAYLSATYEWQKK